MTVDFYHAFYSHQSDIEPRNMKCLTVTCLEYYLSLYHTQNSTDTHTL